MKEESIRQSCELAKERYAELGVDVDLALKKLSEISVSLHCWQGDDVGGFETSGSDLSGGIQVTGNYPGRARTPEELRSDLEQVYKLLPGKHRLNLHSIYGEFGEQRVDRDQYEPGHFTGWVDWARQQGLGLDFNCTCFSHPKADSGFTLSSTDDVVRSFWVEHVKRCRAIGANMGEKLGTPAIHNLWIPDGSKDETTNRHEYRRLLCDSLDKIFSESYPADHLKDSVESKLFGIGSESFVTGSHDFYSNYVNTTIARDQRVMLCLDTGHFHPTESVADKVSSTLLFQKELLLHVSRGVRWDSDHVATFNDETRQLFLEIGRADAFDRTQIALDFFDASINRVGAWVTGTRATLKAILFSLVEPVARLRECERKGDGFGLLALMEEAKTLPLGAVWDYYCLVNDVPPGVEFLPAIQEYERDVLSKR